MSDDIFTEEELAMMNGAEGLVSEVGDLSKRVTALEDQARQLSQMIAEGAEREKELRLKLRELQAA